MQLKRITVQLDGDEKMVKKICTKLIVRSIAFLLVTFIFITASLLGKFATQSVEAAGAQNSTSADQNAPVISLNSRNPETNFPKATICRSKTPRMPI
jgi:hypothetical protein